MGKQRGGKKGKGGGGNNQQQWNNKNRHNNNNQNHNNKNNQRGSRGQHPKNPQAGKNTRNKKQKKQQNRQQWDNQWNNNHHNTGNNHQDHHNNQHYQKTQGNQGWNWNQNQNQYGQQKQQTFHQQSGRPFELRGPWWSVPHSSKDFPYQLLRGHFDTSKDPPHNPFIQHGYKGPNKNERTPLEVSLENIIGWRDVVHDYIEKDKPETENACSTCLSLAHQLLVVKTGIGGAPQFPWDFDMKSPGLIEPESVNGIINSVIEAIRQKDGDKLCGLLQIEPPFAPPYQQLISDLRKRYPPGDDSRLEVVCEERMNDFLEELDTTWGAFTIFLREYLRFIRDVDISNLVITHSKLMALLRSCIYALGDATLGLVVLPTVLTYSKLLTKLTIGLDNRPDLIKQYRQMMAAGSSDEGRQPSLVEASANVIREAFSKCMSDRTGGGIGKASKPEGKRIGIYATANMCLKLFVQCKKIDNATQMFISISQQAPLLSLYPKAQRVTYLFYLGRYMWANSHFYRAVLALEGAYSLCHSSFVKQRRQILIYLIASNLIVGRAPTAKLMSRPEAAGLEQIFYPIFVALQKGNITSFRELTSIGSDSPVASWLLRKRALLQISNRCEVILWRSIARRTFLLAGYHGDINKPNTMSSVPLRHIQAIFGYLEMKVFSDEFTMDGNPLQPISGNANGTPSPMTPSTPAKRYKKALYPGYIDPSFANLPNTYGYDPRPSLAEIESKLASLIDQGLLDAVLVKGENPRLAIAGKGTLSGSLRKGWPNIWRVIKARAEGDGSEVPGWVRSDSESILG